MYRDRIICLADLDCFFVEVERLHRPELKGRPVIIGGQPGKRGVVAACSYEARKLGVHSAMPMAEAYRRAKRAPGVAFLHSGLHGNYTMYSKRIQDILRSEAPVFKAKSIDEFELDISGCERLFERDYGGITQYVEHVRARVRKEVGLAISVGIGPSRIVAKMASRHAKPDGVFRVKPDEVREFLGPHDIQDVPGIGPAIGGDLRARGIHRVEQLLKMPEGMVRSSFGLNLLSVTQALTDSHAEGLKTAAQTMSFQVAPSGNGRAPKSIGHETTFERDVIDPARLKQSLWRLTEDACRRMREQDLRARHVTVKVRYSDFQTVTHGGFLEEATDTDRPIFEKVIELFNQAWSRRLRLRLVGVRLSRFTAGASQLQLFASQKDQREQRLFTAVDTIRQRHGRDSLLIGPGTLRLKSQPEIKGGGTAGISMTPVGQGRRAG